MGKYVLFHMYADVYCMTEKENYESYIRNERKMTYLNGFQSFESVVSYVDEMFGIPREDVIIVN